MYLSNFTGVYLLRLVYELVLPYLLPLVLLAFPYVCLLGENLSQCWGSESGTGSESGSISQR
jgi:hypothetical protein